MFRFPVIAISACLCLSPASAQNALDCDNALTQSDMTQCANMDWQEADADLNAAYKTAMEKMREADSYLPPELQGAADTLRAAQRAWIPYRDEACNAYGFLARGGTMEPMLIAGCLADLTRQRTGELNQLIEGFGSR